MRMGRGRHSHEATSRPRERETAIVELSSFLLLPYPRLAVYMIDIVLTSPSGGLGGTQHTHTRHNKCEC